MRPLFTLLGTGLLCAVLATPVLADDLSATGDTYTQADSPTANFGSSGITAVAVGRTTLLQFNAAAIAQTSGSKAKLNIRVLLAKNATDGVSAHLITSAWNEKTVTAKTLPSIAATALDRQTITKSNQGQVVSFDVSGALASWRSTPATNFGIALVPDSPTPNLQLGSREGGSPAILSLGGVAADNDVTVALSGGDYPDPQSAADNAFAGDKWCVSPQPTKPCTIHVKAGIYTKGSVALPAGLALIGEDRGSTILFGGVSLPSGLVSDLTLQGGGIGRSENPGVGGATVIEVDRVSINLRNQVSAVGLTDGFGSFTMADSQITAINTLPTLPLILFDCEGATGCTTVRVVHSQITGIAPAGGVAFSYSGDAQQALELEDTSVLMSGTPSMPAIDSSGQGLKVTINGGQINGEISGAMGGDSLDIVDAVINGGIDWLESGSVTLEGATLNRGLAVGGSGSTPVSVMRSTINGGLGVSDGVLNLESSVVKDGLNLFGSRGALRSAQVTGTISLQSDGSVTSTATCDHVFDGNLVLRPANCVGP
jgi:hypothetical protein